jgi:hypothetical protein
MLIWKMRRHGQPVADKKRIAVNKEKMTHLKSGKPGLQCCHRGGIGDGLG